MKAFLLSLAAYVQPLLEKTGWNRMEKREKLMVSGLIGGISVLLLFHFFFSPLLDSRQRLQKSLVRKNAELQKIQSMQQEYQSLKLQSGDIQGRIDKRAKNFTLFSYIEKQATTAKVKKSIKYLKPSEIEKEGPLNESRVDMKLQRISTYNLVSFLKGLESEKNVVLINRLSIQQHGKDEGYLNVVIQVITFKKGGA